MLAFMVCVPLRRHRLPTWQLRYVPLVLLSSPSLYHIQARFALTSAQVFSRMDHITDSECFYNSVLELLEDREERDEVDQLITWWNR